MKLPGIEYKAFISYRKARAEYADLVKSVLIEKHGFTSDEIFLDKHDIGPEYFDERISNAICESGALILIVSKDCFRPKEDGEDWFLEEIQLALDINIPIIPVLFDGIRDLNSPEIRAELEKTFTDDEIKKLVKSQAIPYDFDLSEATFTKLAHFINKTEEKAPKPVKAWRYAKGTLAVVGIVAAFFVFFVGIGFLWGYFSSGVDEQDILMQNTHIDGMTAIFEFGGLEAKYDLANDTILIDLQNYNGQIPQSDLEIFVHSCTVSGALILLNTNMNAIKFLKYLKGGSKANKYASAAVLAGACVGSFCGFSQGSKWARSLKQREKAAAMFPKLQSKSFWRPVFEDTMLSYLYFSSLSKGRKVRGLFQNREKVNGNAVQTQEKEEVKVDPELAVRPDVFIRCRPSEEGSPAKKMGLGDNNILCRFNNWEIGNGNALGLSKELERSSLMKKEVVVLQIDTTPYIIRHFTFPEGMAGITFDPPKEPKDITPVLTYYNEWKSSQIPH